MWRVCVLLGVVWFLACAGDPGVAQTGAGPHTAARAAAPRAPGRVYPLDRLKRSSGRRAAACPKLELRKFRGDSVRFEPAARVVEPFRKRLLELERIVNEVSRRVYDRPPSAILVAASYGCRSVRGKQRRLSEHALGNAIDIKGFRFAPARGASARGLPSALKDGFDVRIDQHWKARGSAVRRRHARFLEELTSALLEHDTFRTLLGPAHRDHSDHLHFDMAPQHFVNL
ncbi:MAG: hypothetical protein RL685_2392 [Pseudomonadota bacterium]|jgi:hypothetical protein